MFVSHHFGPDCPTLLELLMQFPQILDRHSWSPEDESL